MEIPMGRPGKAVGPVAHMGRVVKVTSRDGTLSLPHICVCCGSDQVDARLDVTSSLAGRSVPGGQTIYSSTWKLPICEACLGHHKALYQEGKLSIFLAVAAAACLIALFAMQGDAGKAIAALALMLILLALAFVRIRQKHLAKSLLRPKCSALNFVVYAYRAGGKHWFNFANREFAQKLAELNGGTGIPEESLAGLSDRELRRRLRRGR